MALCPFFLFPVDGFSCRWIVTDNPFGQNLSENDRKQLLLNSRNADRFHFLAQVGESYNKLATCICLQLSV